MPSDDERTYTTREHQALLTDGIARETASLQAAKEDLESTFATEKAAFEAQVQGLETEKAELQTRIDVLEAEKADALKLAEGAQTELAEFKAELERAAEIEAKKVERIARVKAAKENVGDDYFTDERVTRWAEMADEQFDALVADLTDVPAGAAAPAATVEQARETAAFSGGKTATAVTPTGGALGALFAATSQVPAALVGAGEQN